MASAKDSVFDQLKLYDIPTKGLMYSHTRTPWSGWPPYARPATPGQPFPMVLATFTSTIVYHTIDNFIVHPEAMLPSAPFPMRLQPLDSSSGPEPAAHGTVVVPNQIRFDLDHGQYDFPTLMEFKTTDNSHLSVVYDSISRLITLSGNATMSCTIDGEPADIIYLRPAQAHTFKHVIQRINCMLRPFGTYFLVEDDTLSEVSTFYYDRQGYEEPLEGPAVIREFDGVDFEERRDLAYLQGTLSKNLELLPSEGYDGVFVNAEVTAALWPWLGRALEFPGDSSARLQVRLVDVEHVSSICRAPNDTSFVRQE